MSARDRGYRASIERAWGNVRILDFSERGHSCPPVGLRVDHHAKADKNVRAQSIRDIMKQAVGLQPNNDWTMNPGRCPGLV